MRFLTPARNRHLPRCRATRAKCRKPTKLGDADWLLNIIGAEFVRNGFLAGGLWRGNDVGALTWGDRLDEGFYFYSDSFDLQSDADREARKMMPVMCAIKLAGAGHSADLLIQFNR
ncbi:DUF3383 family protein [Enterobacteriaceae bacterium ESL0689]|nr:DUF3383 family protein [Enterobacteriaceae bacterium ESL0689]